MSVHTIVVVLLIVMSARALFEGTVGILLGREIRDAPHAHDAADGLLAADALLDGAALVSHRSARVWCVPA